MAKGVAKNLKRKHFIFYNPNKTMSLRKLKKNGVIKIKDVLAGDYISWRGCVNALKGRSNLDFLISIRENNMIIRRLPDRVKENSINNNMV